MNFNMTFTVTARCDKFTKGDNTSEKIDTVDLNIPMDKDKSMNFLFRFMPSSFDLDDYKVLLKFDNYNKLNAVILIDDEFLYVVKNFNQFINDIIEGYNRTRVTEKIVSILDFDFDTFNEINE